MRIRKMLAVPLLAGVIALSGCSGPVTLTETTAKAEDFTPQAAQRVLEQCSSIADVSRIYGDPARAIKDKNHPGAKGYVWEWVATRPSFHADREHRHWYTPTVKKELHAWRDRDGNLTSAEVTGLVYVQFKPPGLVLVTLNMRAMTREELESGRIPMTAYEVFDELDAYYKGKPGSSAGQSR